MIFWGQGSLRRRESEGAARLGTLAMSVILFLLRGGSGFRDHVNFLKARVEGYDTIERVARYPQASI